MNRKMFSSFFLMVMMAAVLLSASAARADLLLTIDNPAQGIGAGQTITVTGTIMATTDLMSIDSAQCSPSGALICDESPFLMGAPLNLLTGESWSGDFFTLTAPVDIAYGNYGVYFNVLFTDENGIQQIAGPIAGPPNNDPPNFTASVPEPGSLLLLGSGLSGLVGVIRRKRQK